jgi:double-stranded RNA-binding protein Staufen
MDDVLNTSSGAELNFAGRLMQLQHARKGNVPVYKDIGMHGPYFIVEVCVDTLVCKGFGRTKKLAKRDAAEKMLNTLGCGSVAVDAADVAAEVVAAAVSAPVSALASCPPTKSALKRTSSAHITEKKVTFFEPPELKEDVKSTSSSSFTAAAATDSPVVTPKPQIVRTSPATPPLCNVVEQHDKDPSPPRIRVLKRPSTNQSPVELPTATVALTISTGDRPTDVPPAQLHSDDTSNLTPVQRLQTVVSSLNLSFQFTDLPKASGSKEYLTIVTILTNPSKITHGVGPSLEEARDNASIKAVAMLKELGMLDSTL